MKNRQTQKAFINDAASLALSALIVKIFGMLYKVPLSYILGDFGMGYFNTAYTVYAFFFILCTTGAPKAITFMIANSISDSNINNEREILKEGLSLFFKIGSIGALLLALFSFPISNILGNKNSGYSIIAIAPSLLILSLSAVLKGYLQGKGMFKKVAISQVIESIGKLLLGLGLSILALKLFGDIKIISAFSMLGISIGSVVSFVYLIISTYISLSVVKEEQKTSISNKNTKKEILKTAFPISISASLTSLVGIFEIGLIMRSLANIGLSESKANELLGNYTTLSLPMLNFACSLITPIAIAIIPKLLKDREVNYQNNSTIKAAYKIIFAIGTPIATIFCLYSFDLLDILFKSSSSILGGELLLLLSPAVILLPLLTLKNTLLEANKHIKYSVISIIGVCLTRLLFIYLLIGKTPLGIYSVAIATTLSYLVGLILSDEFLQIKGLKTKGNLGFLNPLLKSMIAYSVPYILLYKLFYHGIISTLLIVFASSVLYLLLCYKEFSEFFNIKINKKKIQHL